MNVIGRWTFQLGLVVTAAVLVAAAKPAAAYTPEQEQACTPDAMRLCGNFIPDVDQITACMIARQSQLSPECRRFFRPGPEPGEQAAGAPTDIGTVARKPVKPSGAKAKKPKKPAKPADT